MEEELLYRTLETLKKRELYRLFDWLPIPHLLVAIQTPRLKAVIFGFILCITKIN
jgi:hypothetical protein